MTDIIKFDALKDRRKKSEILADQAKWEALDRQVYELIVRHQDLSDTAITSATLSALLDALEAGGLSRSEAKVFIAKSLRAFGEL